MRFHHQRMLFLAVVLFVFFFKGELIFQTLQKNIALHILYHTLLLENTEAVQRQQHLSQVSSLMSSTNPDSLFTSNLPEGKMVPAILQGLANLRAGEMASAAQWFRLAATTHPYPENQQKIWISPWMLIEEDSSLVISGSSELWRIRPDNLQSGTIENKQNGARVFSCNNYDDSARVAFEWIQPYSLEYHHTIQVEAKIERGSTLIIESNIDGELQRPLIMNGDGKWQTSSAPITGTNGKLVYLIVTQDSDDEYPGNCAAQINSIRFLLDNTVTNNKFD